MSPLMPGLIEVGVRRDTTADRGAMRETEIKKDAGISEWLWEIKWAADHVSAERVGCVDAHNL